MLKRIELRNFMSHAHTVIEPADGLTVLIGPNNIGKSAIVAALQVLCHNENSTYVTRHGEKECSVKVETDDGHVIEWRRKNSPSYIIDGQKFDRLKSGCPEELHAVLRLPTVEGAGNTEFDVHFGSQKSPIFLLDSSGANAARFFASSSDASRLVDMQRRHKEKHAAAKRDRTRLEERSAQINRELEHLQPVVGIQQQLEAAETAYDDCRASDDQLAAARSLLTMWRTQAVVHDQERQRGQVLARLMDPPAPHETSQLARLIADLRIFATRQLTAQQELRQLRELSAPPMREDVDGLRHTCDGLRLQLFTVKSIQAQAGVLSKLPPATNPEATQPLGELLSNLATALQARELAALQHDVFTTLPAPEIPSDLTSCSEALNQLQATTADVEAMQVRLSNVTEQWQAVQAELQSAAQDKACPTCGAVFDSERLLEHVLSASGAAHA